MTREIKLPEVGEIYKNTSKQRYVCTGHRIDGFMTKFYRMVRINQNSSYDIEIAMPLFAKCFELETHPESIEDLKAIIDLQQRQLRIEQKETKKLKDFLKKEKKYSKKLKNIIKSGKDIISEQEDF